MHPQSSSPIPQDKIDSFFRNACDILRGAIDPAEYKSIVLTIFFLKYVSDVRKDADQNKEGITEEDLFVIPQGCSFDQLCEKANQIDFGDILNRALWKIETANSGKFDGVLTIFDFNSGFAEQLGYIFRLFVDSHFDFRPSVTDIRIAGDIYSSLLGRFAKQEGARGGEGYTPQNLLPLMVKLLQPREGKSLYDPTVGTGGMLIAADQFVKEQHEYKKGLKLVGQDSAAISVSISKMNLLLHKTADATIHLGDTLSNPKNISEGKIHKYDYVLSSPPFSLKLSQQLAQELEYDEYRRFPFGVPSRIADYVFLQHILSSLTDDGKAVVIVSSRVLFVAGREGDVRKNFIERDLIEAVISFGPGLLTNTSIPIHMLIINKLKPQERRGKILLINASEEYERVGKRFNLLTQENQDKILGAYKNYKPIKSFASLVDVETVKENDYNLMPVRYLDLFSMDDFLGGKVAWVSFEKIADISRSVGSANRSSSGESVPIIRVSDLSNKQINIDGLQKTEQVLDSEGAAYTRTDDILFSLAGGNKAILVDDSISGVMVSNHISIIRLKPEFSHLKQYIVEFLLSDKGYNLLSKYFVGAAAPVLRLSSLRSVKIPIPDVSVTQLISSIHQVEMELLQRIEKAQGLRTKLFSITDADVVQKQLDELGTDTKILASSLVRADSLDYQVRNFYPYPLAYSYRTLSAIYDPVQRYPEQLRVAENLLVFLAVTGLTLAQSCEVLNDQTDITNTSIQKFFEGGISPGDWQSLAYFTGKLIREQRRYAISDSFASLWFKGKGSRESEFAKITKTLVVKKNDFKHDRGPKSPHDFDHASKELQELLDICYSELSFLIKYPIRLVQDIDVDWQTGNGILETLVYEGDHPGLRREKVEYPKPLTKEFLYLELDKGQWATFYPHVSVQYCESCKTRETYFIDRWDGTNNKSVLKSFERGHTHDTNFDAKKVVTNFEHWINSNLT